MTELESLRKEISALREELATPMLVSLNRLADALADERANIERAYCVLEAYNVPRERANTVATGIDVLATRFRKAEMCWDMERNALQAKLSTIDPELPEYQWPFQTWNQGFVLGATTGILFGMVVSAMIMFIL